MDAGRPGEHISDIRDRPARCLGFVHGDQDLLVGWHGCTLIRERDYLVQSKCRITAPTVSPRRENPQQTPDACGRARPCPALAKLRTDGTSLLRSPTIGSAVDARVLS